MNRVRNSWNSKWFLFKHSKESEYSKILWSWLCRRKYNNQLSDLFWNARITHPYLQLKANVKRKRFTEVDVEDIKKETLKLNKDKAFQVTNILLKFIKDIGNIFASFLFENISSAFKSSLFPVCLKLAYVTP